MGDRSRPARFLILASVLASTCGWAKVEWSVRHAAGGLHRFGEPVPAAVTLDNGAGDDTTVVIRAEAQGRTLHREVELPAGSLKRFVFYVLAGDYSDRYEIELAELGGDVFGEVELASEGVGSDAVTVGILGAAPMGWEEIEADDDDGMDLRRGHIRPADLPPHAEGLKSYDLLVWPDPDPGALRPEQVRAVTQWVAEGGRLAILVAERWLEASAGGLEPWTTIRVAAPAPASRLDSVAEGRGAGPLTFQPALSVPVLSGGDPWLDEPFGSIARDERRGLGRVTVIAFDPSRPELSGWGGWPVFWRDWLHRWQGPSRLAGHRHDVTLTGNGEPLFERLRVVSSVRLPEPHWILVLFVIYLLLIGPVEYTLLRRKRRLHWTWFTFPVLIVAASSVGYLAAEAVHRGSSVKQGIVLRDLWSDYDLVSEETRVSAYVTRQGRYRMECVDTGALSLPSYDTGDMTLAWRRARLGLDNRILDQGVPAVEGRVAKWSHMRGRFVGSRSAAGATASARWQVAASGGSDDAFPEAMSDVRASGSLALHLGVENAGVWLLAVSPDDGWPVLHELGELTDGGDHRFDVRGQRLEHAWGRLPDEDRGAAKLVALSTASPVLARLYGYESDRRRIAGAHGGLVTGRRIDWSSWLESGGGVLIVETEATEDAVRLDGVPDDGTTRVFYRIPVAPVRSER